MEHTFFITGTDTDAGKTVVACALLKLAASKGLSCLGLKPLAAGGEVSAEGVHNADALALQACASIKLPYAEVNPIALAQAMAPHIAAANEGKHLSIEQLVEYVRAARARRVDFCVIEGAGGWRVPVNQEELLSALPKALNVPVVLVVGMRLGCLNHALLSYESIVRDGLRVAGWVANLVEPKMDALDENIATLQSYLPCPLLGKVPYLASKEGASEALAQQATAYLDIEPLIQGL